MSATFTRLAVAAAAVLVTAPALAQAADPTIAAVDHFQEFLL